MEMVAADVGVPGIHGNPVVAAEAVAQHLYIFAVNKQSAAFVTGLCAYVPVKKDIRIVAACIQRVHHTGAVREGAVDHLHQRSGGRRLHVNTVIGMKKGGVFDPGAGPADG